MTDAEITAVIQGLHPDLKVGEMELRVGRAIAQAEKERCARIAEIEHMTPKDIVRVIRSNYPDD